MLNLEREHCTSVSSTMGCIMEWVSIGRVKWSGVVHSSKVNGKAKVLFSLSLMWFFSIIPPSII